MQNPIEQGKNKDCPCANYWDSFESTVDQEILDDRQKFFKEIAEMSDEPAPSGPKCDIENTDFPIDAFYSQNYNLAGKSFCPGWEEHKDSSLTMTVNEEGYQMPLLGKRTPPANLANLIDWRAQLKFDKAEGVNDCAKTCDEAFQDFRLHCGGSSCKFYLPLPLPLPPPRKRFHIFSFSFVLTRIPNQPVSSCTRRVS